MKWRGFITESKAFMSYDTRNSRDKFAFWWHFPRALVRYLWTSHHNKVIAAYNKATQATHRELDR